MPTVRSWITATGNSLFARERQELQIHVNNNNAPRSKRLAHRGGGDRGARWDRTCRLGRECLQTPRVPVYSVVSAGTERRGGGSERRSDLASLYRSFFGTVGEASQLSAANRVERAQRRQEGLGRRWHDGDFLGFGGVRGQFSTPSLVLCASGARRAMLSQQDVPPHRASKGSLHPGGAVANFTTRWLTSRRGG